MIVAETPEGCRFVTQPDHAALVGQFADHWGNDRFDRPEPSPAVAIAAHVHDDGWWSRDRRPYLCDDGTPEDFTEISPEPWIALYDRGIDAAVEIDPYAGLLVSMHGAGLRRRRYGLSPTWPTTPPAYEDFVDGQEERQRTLARELHEEGGPVTDVDLELLSTLHQSGSAPAETDSRLWQNYELLQAWDTLSLAFCTTVSPPAYGEVGPVPAHDPDRDVTLSIEALDDGSFAVDPYPFDVEPVVASVPVRTVLEHSFDDEDEAVHAFFECGRERVEFAIRRAVGSV